MNEMQRFLVDERIHDLQHEATRIRAERERDHRPVARPATSSPAPTTAVMKPAAPPQATMGGPSTRVRLGRWLVEVGAAIAGTTVAVAAPRPAVMSGSMREDGPCQDGPAPLSHAA
jgi:hypothetical protein